MASSTIRKQCASGNGCKQAAVANCEGCSQTFCGKHFNDHRNLLSAELNVIFGGCNELKDSLNQQTTNTDSHLLIKQINEWEKISIATIQQRAEELRQKLLQKTTAQRNELSQKLQQLSQQANDAREYDSFSETDLSQWTKALDDLKTNLTSPLRRSINQSDNSSLVQNIFLNVVMTNDLFQQVSDSTVRIEENGQLITRDAINDHTDIRGKNEYTSGLYKIRLCIEESPNLWMLLGINSKLTPIQRLSYNSKSTYGWSSNNYIWLNGQQNPNKSSVDIEIKKGDLINLVFDCDNCTITMINERTNKKHELSVDITCCPFPWQLHVNLCEANGRVRILPS